ncbi:MAG TPA: VirB3 family type IV secretion system protein [Sphingorhabdus sp.]|jgi:type IV secretion system protein VirB3|nr:VirB3 family type IV secretion system protein [Sphingorhabdus sp.]
MAALDRTPLFRALTQPQMFAGVTYSFFIVNVVITTELFLITRSFWAVPAALLIHGIGYMAGLKEPRIFDLWIMKASRCGRTRTHGLWKCNSYRP